MVLRLRIDMTLTDEHVFEFIAQNSDNGKARLTLQQIAAAIGCHPNTVWSATNRLQSAGRIRKIATQGRKGGINFEVIDA